MKPLIALLGRAGQSLLREHGVQFTTSSIAELIRIALHHDDPPLVVLDWLCPGAPSLLARLRMLSPSMEVMVLGAHELRGVPALTPPFTARLVSIEQLKRRMYDDRDQSALMLDAGMGRPNSQPCPSSI